MSLIKCSPKNEWQLSIYLLFLFPSLLNLSAYNYFIKFLSQVSSLTAYPLESERMLSVEYNIEIVLKKPSIKMLLYF